jgi:hypothetical protein
MHLKASRAFCTRSRRYTKRLPALVLRTSHPHQTPHSPCAWDLVPNTNANWALRTGLGPRSERKMGVTHEIWCPTRTQNGRCARDPDVDANAKWGSRTGPGRRRERKMGIMHEIWCLTRTQNGRCARDPDVKTKSKWASCTRCRRRHAGHWGVLQGRVSRDGGCAGGTACRRGIKSHGIDA